MEIALWIMVIILFIIVTALIAWCISLEKGIDQATATIFRISMDDRARHLKDFHGGTG
jgi:hypothetical protein